MDIIDNPRNAATRRRIEWPSMNPDFIQMVEQTKTVLPNPSTHTREEALKLLQEEKEKCDMTAPVPYDNGIFDIFPTHIDRTADICKCLTVLYYRGRLQNTILDVFTMLVQRGFISLDSLREYITLGTWCDATDSVKRLLYTFQAVVDESNYDLTNQSPFPLWSIEPVYEAVKWLATMIVRGCANIEQLLETIEMSRFLGRVNKEALEEHLKEQPTATFTCDPKDRAPKYIPSGPDNDFGFWLPHGLGNGPESELLDKIADIRIHFHRIERVYKRFFDIKDDVLITAEQQAAYLDTRAHKCSGTLKSYLQNEAEFRRCSDVGRDGGAMGS